MWPQKGLPFFKTFDIETANKIAAERMGQIGIDVRDPSQAVGTMSGGERQCLAKHCLSPPDIVPTA